MNKNKRLKMRLLLLIIALICSNYLRSEIVSDKVIINAPFGVLEFTAPNFPDKDFVVTEYGAEEKNQVAFSHAVKEAIQACSSNGGGRVVIPKGYWYSGPIHLKSNVNLHISKGANIRFSDNPDDYLPVVFTRYEGFECYNYSPLIYAKDCENIAITGKGTLDGNGEKWWAWKKLQKRTQVLYDMVLNNTPVKERIFGTEEAALRPSFIQFVNCTNVLYEDFTVLSGPFWTIHPVYCKNVIARGIQVITHGPNTDGFDLDSSEDILVDDCYFDTGDDCVVLKSGMNEDGWRVGKPTRNVIVRNLYTKRGHGGVVCGSDVSGGIENVYVYDCYFEGTDIGIRMKAMRGRGGYVKNVYVKNVTMKDITNEPIRLNMFYKASTIKPNSKEPSFFSNIHLENITCEGAGKPFYILGLPELFINNIQLKNIVVTGAKNSALCENAENINFEGLHITSDADTALLMKNTKDISFDKLSLNGNAKIFARLSGDISDNIKANLVNLPKVEKEIVVLENDFNAGSVTGFEIETETLGTSILKDSDEIFYKFLKAKVYKQLDERKKILEKDLESKNLLLERQEYLKEKYNEILGDFPEKSPLNPVITGKIDKDKYTIEKVAYESQPGYYVTANLYIPKGLKSKAPAVLFPCGHSANGKASSLYQKAGIVFALNGFVTLIPDPISQGERYQFLDKKGNPITRGGTLSHAQLDVPANLLGYDVLTHELWDNIRSLDYLESRPEVDKTKIGLSGNSGGGTQTTYLVAYDKRIKAAAPSCYIASYKWKLEHHTVADGCQQLSHEGYYGIEEQDFLFMAAPTPIRILAQERDFFPFEGTLEAYHELKSMYSKLGYPDNIDFQYDSNTHGFFKPLREYAVQWMKKWLMNDISPVVEPDNLEVLTDEEISVTKTGQALTYFQNAKNITDLNLELFNDLKDNRDEFFKNDKEYIINKIVELTAYKSPKNVKAEKIISINNGSYTAQKLLLERDDAIDIPAILFVPNDTEENTPAIIIADEKGKLGELNGLINQKVNEGNIVLTLDVSGYGELKDFPARQSNIKFDNIEYRNSLLAYFSGSTVMGYKMADIISATLYLRNYEYADKDNISLIGIGKLGPVVLHAAAVGDYFSSVKTIDSIESWKGIIENPVQPNLFGIVVPRALKYYDLSDLKKIINN